MRFVWFGVSLAAAVVGFVVAFENWSALANDVYGPVPYVCLLVLVVCPLYNLGNAISRSRQTSGRSAPPTLASTQEFAAAMASLSWSLAFFLILMVQIPHKGGNAAFVGAMVLLLACFVFIVLGALRKRRRVQPKS
jgi:hypothetical protein